MQTTMTVIRDGVDIEVDIEGEEWQSAEPDVGIMSGGYCYVIAKWNGDDFQLNEVEEQIALDKLNQMAWDNE